MQLTERDGRRFWSKVALPDTEGHLHWTASRTDGYGRLKLDGRLAYAHRISYAVAYGAIPDGMVIDHLCRVRHCVTPDHLEAVTTAENTRRGETGAHNGTKTHCRQGHEFTQENTYLHPKGERVCRTCRRAAAARSRAKRRTA